MVDQNLRSETPLPAVSELVTGHFREGPGYAVWRSKGTGDWLLMLTLAGQGRLGFQAPGRAGETIVRPGDLVLIRPGTLHDYGVEPSLQRWELLWIHFQPRPGWLELLGWPEDAPGLMRITLTGESRRQISSCFRAVHAYANGSQRRRTALAMARLEELLLSCDAVNPRNTRRPVDPRVRDAMDFLCRRMAEPITLAAVAAHVSLSASRLSHLFRAQVGVTLQQFLETRRLGRAQQLLALTPHTIKEIAREVGFENPFYFTLRFKRLTGESPRAWRRRVVAPPSPRGPRARGAI